MPPPELARDDERAVRDLAAAFESAAVSVALGVPAAEAAEKLRPICVRLFGGGDDPLAPIAAKAYAQILERCLTVVARGGTVAEGWAAAREYCDREALPLVEREGEQVYVAMAEARGSR